MEWGNYLGLHENGEVMTCITQMDRRKFDRLLPIAIDRLDLNNECH